MKKIVIYLMAIMPILGFTSCENDEPENPVYHDIEIDSVEIDGVTYDFEWVCSDDISQIQWNYQHVDHPFATAVNIDKQLKEVSFKGVVAKDFVYDGEIVNLEFPVRINARAFRGCDMLETIKIDSNVASVYVDDDWNFNEETVFGDCVKLKDIYLYHNPHEIRFISTGCDYETVTLHVKKGTKDEWIQCEPWSKFRNIVEDL